MAEAVVDTIDKVMLDIENERLDRRIELIREAKKIYESQLDTTDELKQMMAERIDPAQFVSSGGGGSSRNTDGFTVDNFKYGLTTFMMNKITEVINKKFNDIDKTTKTQFVNIFETLKDLILENKDDPDYNNFVNDVLFIFYNCVLELDKMSTDPRYGMRVDAAIQEAVIAFENFSKHISERDNNFPVLSSRSQSSYDTSSSDSSDKSSLTIESIKSKAFEDFYEPEEVVQTEEVVQNKNGRLFTLRPIKKIQVVEVKKDDNQSQSMKIMITVNNPSVDNSIDIPQDKLQKLVLADSVLNHVYSDSLIKTKEFRESNFTKAVHSGVAFSQIVSDIIPKDDSTKKALFIKFGELAFAQSEYEDQTDSESKSSSENDTTLESINQQQKKPNIPVLNLFDLTNYAQSLSQISNRPSTAQSNISDITMSSFDDLTMSSFDDFFIEQFNEFHKPEESNDSIDKYTSSTGESTESEIETETDVTNSENRSAENALTAFNKLKTDTSIIGLLHRTEDDFLTIVTHEYIQKNIQKLMPALPKDVNTNTYPARTHKFFIGYLKKNDKTKMWESHLRTDDFDDYRHLKSEQTLDTELKRNLRIIYRENKDKTNKIKLTGQDLQFDGTGCGRSGTAGQKEKACANATSNVYNIFEKTMEEYSKKTKKEDIHSILYLLVVEKVNKSKNQKKGQNPSNFTIIPFHEPNLI